MESSRIFKIVFTVSHATDHKMRSQILKIQTSRSMNFKIKVQNFEKFARVKVSYAMVYNF